MRYTGLRSIQRLYFGHEEIARTLGIGLASAKVTATRYVKQGLLVRIKRNFYVLSEKWQFLDAEQTFQIANLIQVPSYVSLMTALEYYEITTQMQQNFIESVSVKRTVQTRIEQVLFKHTKISNSLYFGFGRRNRFFIAEPEKAFMDAVYLMSLGRYTLDFASIDLSKLNMEKIESLCKKFPTKTRSFWMNHEQLRKARNL